MAVAARSFFQEAKGLDEGLHRVWKVRSNEDLDVFGTAAPSSRCSASPTASPSPLAASCPGRSTCGRSDIASSPTFGAGSGRNLASSSLIFLGEERKRHRCD